MAKKYGMGVVGAGMIGNFHAEAIRELPNADLVAVCDHVEEVAKGFAAKHGCEAYADMAKFLADDRIDVITIGTPSGLHGEAAIAAAQAGKHCLVEKPIEITLPKIDAILEEDALQKILCFACNWCSYAGADTAGTSRFQYPPNARLIRTMCSGRVRPEFVWYAFQKGAPVVLVSGCHYADCHYIDANRNTVRRVDALWEGMEKQGVRPMIYVSSSFWAHPMSNGTDHAALGQPLWVAHWHVTNPRVHALMWNNRDWTLWQWTSGGHVKGIDGRVDMNVYNGTDLGELTIGVARSNQRPVEPLPVPKPSPRGSDPVEDADEGFAIPRWDLVEALLF